MVTFLLATQEKSDSAAKGRRKLLLYAQVSLQAYQLKCDACLRRHDEARVRGAQGAVSVFAGMTRWGARLAGVNGESGPFGK